jgi:hypothetical protein
MTTQPNRARHLRSVHDALDHIDELQDVLEQLEPRYRAMVVLWTGKTDLVLQGAADQLVDAVIAALPTGIYRRRLVRDVILWCVGYRQLAQSMREIVLRAEKEADEVVGIDQVFRMAARVSVVLRSHLGVPAWRALERELCC